MLCAFECVQCRRLEEVVKAVGGGYCWLQMPLRLALGVRGTVAGHSLGALEGGGGTSPPSNASLPPGPPPPTQRKRVSNGSTKGSTHIFTLGLAHLIRRDPLPLSGVTPSPYQA